MYERFTRRGEGDPIPYIGISELLGIIREEEAMRLLAESDRRADLRARWEVEEIEVAGAVLVPGKYYDLTVRQYSKSRRVLSVRYIRRHPRTQWSGENFDRPSLHFSRAVVGVERPLYVEQSTVIDVAEVIPSGKMQEAVARSESFRKVTVPIRDQE